MYFFGLTTATAAASPVSMPLSNARIWSFLVDVMDYSTSMLSFPRPGATIYAGISGASNTSSGEFHDVLKIKPLLVFSRADADYFLGAFDESMEEVGG